MKLGLIVYSNDAETVWNAFRFGNFALKQQDSVQIFLLGKGVEAETIGSDRFNVVAQMTEFAHSGGVIYACGTCLKVRGSEGSDVCPISTLADLHRIVTESDRVLCF